MRQRKDEKQRDGKRDREERLTRGGTEKRVQGEEVGRRGREEKRTLSRSNRIQAGPCGGGWR